MLAILASLTNLTTPTSAFAANLPPRWEMPTEYSTQDKIELNLDKAFFDPDGDPLSYSVTPSKGTSAGVYGNKLIAMPEQTSTITITASDGKNIVSQKITIYLR